MTVAVLPAPADRFALVLDGLCRAIAARSAGAGKAAPLLVLVWTRLRRLAARFAVLAARVRAGALPSASPAWGRDASRPPSPRPLRRLPGGFGWLLRLVPEAASYGGQLRHLLSDPEMAALLAAAPRMGLHPLCRMLGVEPEAHPHGPPRGTAASPSRSSPPGPITGAPPIAGVPAPDVVAPDLPTPNTPTPSCWPAPVSAVRVSHALSAADPLTGPRA